MIRSLPLDLAWVFIISLTSLGIGSQILSKLKFPNRSFHFLFSVGTGLAFFSYLVFILGFLGVLYPWVFRTTLIILFGICFKELQALMNEIKNIKLPEFTKFEMILTAILLTAILGNFIFNYSPPTQPRETMYDLSIPKMYLDAHRIFELKDKQVYYYPLQIQMLYIMGMALNGVLIAKLIHFLFGILSLGMVYFLTRYFFGEKSAFLSAVIFYLMPMITSLSGTANIDLGTLFYGLVTLTSILFWVHSEKRSFLYCGSFFAGVVLGTKLIGLSTALLVLLFSIFWIFLYQKVPLRQGIKQIFWVGLFILLGVSPWIFRNIYFTGNPFAPVSLPLLGILGHPDSNLELLLNAQAKTSMIFSDTLKGFRNIFFGEFIYGGGPLLFTFLLPVFLRKETRKNSLLLFSLALLNYVILFFLLPIHHRFYETRYYIVSYGIFALLAGVGVDTVLSLSKNKKFIQGIVLAALFFPCLLFSLLFSFKRLPLFLGIQSQESYLRGKLNFFNVFTYANQNIPAQSKVLTLGASNPDQFYWDSILIAPSLNLLQERNSQKILDYLNLEGINYIYFFDAAYKTVPNSLDLFPKWNSIEILRWNWEEFKTKYLTGVYHGADGTLYRITF